MKNFAWIATWKITRRCNLYCVYCDHASMRKATYREHIDYKKIIRTLRTYSPKILNISGGEPTLVEALPEILSEVKKQWNPFIRIVHNGTNPEKLLPCLPNVDRLVISLDGPDPINKENRGISADTVFKKLKEVLPQLNKHHVQVYFNCVITTANLTYMSQLVHDAYNLSPSITVSFTPVMPPDSNLSILRDKKLVSDFLETYKKLKQQKYPIMHVFDGIMQHADFKNIKCYNQYFTIKITPEGQVVTCAMNTELTTTHFNYYFRKMFSKKGIKTSINRLKKMANHTLFNKVDFSCNTICACENWLDLIFLGIHSDCIWAYARGLSGRMTEADYSEVEAFVRKNIASTFDSTTFKNIVDTALLKIP